MRNKIDIAVRTITTAVALATGIPAFFMNKT